MVTPTSTATSWKSRYQKKKETLAARAENIKGKLFLGNETMAFIDYIDKTYQSTLSHRALSSFQKNKERDLALIALLLASGVRLSEAVNLDVKDLNLNMMIIEVTRKGGKRDAVNIAGLLNLIWKLTLPFVPHVIRLKSKTKPSFSPNTVGFQIASTHPA